MLRFADHVIQKALCSRIQLKKLKDTCHNLHSSFGKQIKSRKTSHTGNAGKKWKLVKFICQERFDTYTDNIPLGGQPVQCT